MLGQSSAGPAVKKVPCDIAKFQRGNYTTAQKCEIFGSCSIKRPINPATGEYYPNPGGIFSKCVINKEGTDCECVEHCGKYNFPTCRENAHCNDDTNKKCFPDKGLYSTVGECRCQVPCTAKDAEAEECSDGGCPLSTDGKPQKCVLKSKPISCKCEVELKPCTVENAPACNGKCSEGETCLPAEYDNKCECKKNCQKDYTGEKCEGLCVDGNKKPIQNSECTRLTNKGCKCLVPCRKSDAPSCGGECNSPSLKCVPANENVPELGCTCRTIEECEGDVNDHCFDKKCDSDDNGKERACRHYPTYDEYGQGSVGCGCFYKDEVIEGLPPRYENEKI